MSDDRTRKVSCCIAGGGPAGVMLGFLLARSGVEVLVLEKHADFFRDFRGDTVHPSTLRVMDELGLLDAFLQRPHSELHELTARIGDTNLTMVDFSHIPGRCKFLAFMPQWDFLDFLAEQGRKYPTFGLEMNAEAKNLIVEGGVVRGVTVQTPTGSFDVRADLVVAADGRSSMMRAAAGLRVIEVGAPIDVLWMRLSRKPTDPGQTFGNIAGGGILVAINREEYYQCAFVIRKGGFDAVRAAGIEQLRAEIARIAPFLADRVDELKTWDDVKLLTVTVDRLATWYRDGLLCIGDAAHAMSPVGGVGINLAIQDAVAAANALVEPLRRGAPVSTEVLKAIQTRREMPTKVIQGIQVFIQRNVLSKVLSTDKIMAAPPLIRWLAAVPLFRSIPAYIVGIGPRPEHVQTPAA